MTAMIFIDFLIARIPFGQAPEIASDAVTVPNKNSPFKPTIKSTNSDDQINALQKTIKHLSPKKNKAKSAPQLPVNTDKTDKVASRLFNSLMWASLTTATAIAISIEAIAINDTEMPTEFSRAVFGGLAGLCVSESELGLLPALAAAFASIETLKKIQTVIRYTGIAKNIETAGMMAAGIGATYAFLVAPAALLAVTAANAIMPKKASTRN